MQDNQPGAPPTEPEKPKVITDKVPHFSFRDLMFDDAFTEENRKFIRFLISNEHPCFVELLRIEYMQYADLYFNKYDSQVENELCSCDSCYPFYEEIGVEKFIFQETGESEDDIKEVETELPVYYIYGLSEAFKIGIHTDNHKEEIK